MTDPLDYRPPITFREVYQEHFRLMMTSKSWSGRICHALTLGIEGVLFPIALVEAAYNRAYRNSNPYPSNQEIEPLLGSRASENLDMAPEGLLTMPATTDPHPNSLSIQEELSKNSSPSVIQNKELLELYFGENQFSMDILSEFATLSPKCLKLLLIQINKPIFPLWNFVHYWIEYFQEDSPLEERMTIAQFFQDSSITKDEYRQISQVATAVYMLSKSNLKESSTSLDPALRLIHTSPGLPAAIGDQALYEKQFTETVDKATHMMKTTPIFSNTFNTCLAFIADQRHEMAKSAYSGWNNFGLPRAGSLTTPLNGAYEKYRDWFVKSHKNEWEKIVERGGKVYYQITVFLNGRDLPTKLTRIENGIIGYHTPALIWFHTNPENIEIVLKKAKSLFEDLLKMKVEHTDQGLEIIMKSVGELHWWLAQACPYQRGSAAIAKMMACAILKYHGIEPGGFGEIEPDCMALIQGPIEFTEKYSQLMRHPPPHWL